MRLPARREVIELTPAVDTLDALKAYVSDHGAKATVTSDGHLGLRLPNGGLVVLTDSAELVRPFANAPGQLLGPLNDNPGRLLDVLTELASGRSGLDAVAEILPRVAGVETADRGDDLDASDIVGSSSAAGLPNPLDLISRSLGTDIDPLTSLNPETRRWGRDDLKRGEAGSQGQNVTTGLGSGLDHLTGLSDEELGHRNGEKLVTFDNALFPTVGTGVGSSLDHLWLLGDTEYLRASRDLAEGEDVFEPREDRRIVYGPLIEAPPVFSTIEDIAFAGALFPIGSALLPITNADLVMDPSQGTIRLEPDGGLFFTPAPNYSGEATFTYSFTDPRTGLPVTGTGRIIVEAVADPASISGAARTPEDTLVRTPITVTLNDRDGSESIEKVVITGLPAGATLAWDTSLPGRIVQSGSTFTVTGSTEEIQALLASLTVDPPSDFHGQIVLGVAVTSIEDRADPNLPGYRDRETVRFDYVIDVVAVADPVTATGDDETTDEDIAVHLDDLAATFGDLLDGSETHTVEIRGVVSGARLLDADGGTEYPFTLAPDGTKTYTLTPAQVGSVWFLPPLDASGTFDGMSIVAIATETSNGDRQTASAPIRVVVAPVADPVEITAPTQATNEDTPVTFGTHIVIVESDPASQTITEVVVAGFPAGTRIQYTNEVGVPVDIIAPPGGGTVTLGGAGSGFSETQIRAALATLTLTPPVNSDADIQLTISATTLDTGAGGPPVSDTRTVPMTITVAAVADMPDATYAGGPNVVTEPATGAPLRVEGVEDQNLPVPVTLDLTDLDGTETMDPVRITGLPTGYNFQGLTRQPDGSYLISGTKAAIQATLAALVIVPPANADDDFTLQVTVTSRESNPTTAGTDAGQVAVLTATRVLDIPVVFIAAPDHPVITGGSSVVEDNTVNFGNNIVITRDDTADGSETITRVVISNVPAGAVVGHPGDGTLPAVPGVTVAVGVDGSGNPTYTLTRTTGSEADLLSAMRALTITPPADSDVDISLNVAVTTTDNDGIQGFGSATHTIIVRADAVGDEPILSASGSGNEDQPIHLIVNAALDDSDTSEFLSQVEITGLPVGATLTWTALPTGVATPVAIPGGFRFSPVDDTPASTAALQTFLQTNLRVTSPLHQDDDITLTIVATNTERATGATQVENQSSSSTINVTLTVLPIADPASIGTTSTGIEDQPAAVGAAIEAGLAKVDDNSTLATGPSSETVTAIRIHGIPAGASWAVGTIDPALVTVAGSLSEVVFALTAAGSEQDLRDALATLTLTPPHNSDVDIPLLVDVTTTDRRGTPEAHSTTTVNLSHTVVVTADAAGDEPTITGAATGVEDTNFALPITITMADTDGSEILDRVEITGLPTGATISWAADDLPLGVTATAIPGGWTFNQTSASYATTVALQNFLQNHLFVRAPQDSAADFQLSVTAYNYEQNLSGAGGRTAALPSTTATIDVTVTPAFDTVTLPPTSSLVNEDEDRAPSTSDGSAPFITNIPGSVVFGAVINSGLVRTGDTGTFDPTDRSEGISQIVLSGLPTGTVTWTDQPGVTVTPNGAGTSFTIAASGTSLDPVALEAAIRQVLATFTYAASDHGSADIPVAVEITRQDIDPDTGIAITGVALTATHTIVVNAVADAPIVTGDTETTREDVPVHLDSLTAALRDLDGSETLSVQITGVPTGGSLTNGLGGAAFASPSAGVYTIPVASLGNVFFVPPPEASGIFNMTIVATATEATVAGEPTADDVASVRAPIVVTVTPVVDPVVANNSGSFVNENGTFNLGANILESATDGDTVPDFTLTDLDGSQSLSITIAGFPTGITAFMNPAYTLLGDVTANFDAGAGTFTLAGTNAAHVMAALAQVRSTVTEDGDANFALTVTAVTDENNPLGLPEAIVGDHDATTTIITHDVRVLAVADTPTVDRGTEVKSAVLEDSGFVAYPVTTALNDTDGSESWQSIVVQFSTPGIGARPVLQFQVGVMTFDTQVNGSYLSGGVSMTVTNGQVTFAGPTNNMNTALASMQVRPGSNNGEDITVTVTATAIESHPSEDNNGAAIGMGGGIVGPEIAVPTATTSQTFLIPVTPVPDLPTLTVPGPATGDEDTIFGLGIFALSGTPDTDGSEARFIEIATASFPVGTRFISGGADVGTVSGGFVRIPESAIATLSIEPPTHFSGTINLSVRAVVVDTNTSSGAVTQTTAAQAVAITVRPVADGITPPSASVTVEDLATPVAFGATLANTTTGIRLIDNGADVAPTEDNNPETETISRIVLTVPAATAGDFTVAHGTAVGSAVVTQGTNGSGETTYSLTSTLITGDGSGVSLANRQQAEADIRATLATFTATGTTAHQDTNRGIGVSVTTLDVNGGVANAQDNPFTHSIVVQAVADAPSVSATTLTATGNEDATRIPLVIDVGRSADDDGSETLTVRITVPQGSDGLGPIGTLTGSLADVTLTHQGGGVYLITATGANNAAREALFDEFMNGGANDLAFVPRANWSGTLTPENGILVEAISTEAATLYGDTNPATDDELAQNDHAPSGTTGDVDTRVEIRTAQIGVEITPIVDAPTVKGNGVGQEDTDIPVPMSVTLADRDGSETYQVLLTAVIPPDTVIKGAGGAVIPLTFDATLNQNVYVLDPDDVEALTIVPPLHYSAALTGPIQLQGVARVTDGTLTVDFPFTPIAVDVRGVADVPGDRTVIVTSNEDDPIAIGAAVLTSSGGNLNNLLVDTDSSESLSFVLSGVPQGVIPTTTNPTGGVTYIGNGTWSITAEAMATLALPPVRNFSGENPTFYDGVRLRAVTQEIDGDQATSPEWNLTIRVNPVINAGVSVDGFASWNLGATQSEATSEGGQNISLASAANHTLIDNDGSEQVISYTFDLSGLIANAGIAARLASLPGAGSGLDKLVANYITGFSTGAFTYDAGAGTITVPANRIGEVALRHELFLDSNQDFTIPVEALVRDTAFFPSLGTSVSVDKTELGTFAVDLIGTADTPTVFINEPVDGMTGRPTVSGNSGTQLSLDLGGISTDTDAALGRAASEDIYYIVQLLNPGTAPPIGFTNGAGAIVGLDNGDGTWLLTPGDLAGLHVMALPGSQGTANLTLTTIAVENDGDTASNTAPFDVVVSANPGDVPGPAPLPPTVTIGTSSGLEDGSIALVVTAERGTDAFGNPDPTDPTVSVMISDLPPGAGIVGARFNSSTNRWVASADDVNNGLVRIIPPANFSGTLTVTVEAVATGPSLLQATTGTLAVPLAVTPVADGVAISATPDAGLEDTLVDLNIGLAVRDTTGALPGENGAEVLGANAYVQLSDGGAGATLPGFTQVLAGDSDATVDGQSLVGFYRVPAADVPSLRMLPANDWHGTVTVTVAAFSQEPVNGDIALNTHSFGVTVAAVADAPSVMASNASGTEDTAITLTGLSAALNDAITTNGAEVLSVKITGVPDGSIFSAGTNNGDGSWTIPVGSLAGLSLTPPLHFAGTMALTLTAIALELANGDEAQTSVAFTVTVAPAADSVEILAKNVVVDGSGEVALDLNVRMADNRGTLPGEHPAEQIRITFTSVPTGVSFEATDGGTITQTGPNTWEFLGNEAQSNAIAAVVVAGVTAGNHTISLSAVTIDQGSILATPVTDSFRLTVPTVVNGTTGANSITQGAGTQLIFGLGGADTINGGAGDDLIVGGTGADILTGGGGIDTFRWDGGELGTGVDRITDFTPGTGADRDVLDISALLIGFDPATSVINDYVLLSQSSGNTTVRVDANGAAGGSSFQNLVVLEGITGLNLNDMRTNGNLIV